MLFHLITHAMNISFSNDVAIIQQHNAVRHHVNFMKNVGGDDQVQTFGSKFPKQRDCFRAYHWIQPVEWLIKNHYHRLMSNRLREPDSLPHSFAVGSNFPVCCVEKIYTLARYFA